MKHADTNQKHQFALYIANLSAMTAGLEKGQSFTIIDTDFVHRIIAILRLSVGQSFQVFDQKVQVFVTIIAAQKNKSVQMKIDEKQYNRVLEPGITFLLPLLKKESLETALYSLTEIGATQIQLVITQKSQQRWTTKEQERAQKIIIAAAEQSKNFTFPQLVTPIELDKIFAQLNSSTCKIFFDPAGIPLSECLKQIKDAKPKQIVLAIGPEGDLMAAEKDQMRRKGFTFCALTPTVLRACQAAALSTGVIRSI